MSETVLLRADRAADMARAVALLRDGALVAVPTETVYGLAADARQAAAVARIFSAKGRPAGHPLIVHLADVAQLGEWAQGISPLAQRLAAHFWPGALTLLLPRGPAVDAAVTGGQPSIGLRVPSHPVLHSLLSRLGTGLAAPSANRYRKLSPTRAEHVLHSLGGRIDAVLDGGPCTLGLESTIVDLTGPQPRLVRPGPITVAQLERVAGEPLLAANPEVRAPGSDSVHYQPSTPAFLVDEHLLDEALASAAEARHRVGLLLTSASLPVPAVAEAQVLPNQPAGYAVRLYAALHELDHSGLDTLLIVAPPRDAAWLHIHNRLARATVPWPGSHNGDALRG